MGVVYKSGAVTVRDDLRHPGRYRITWVDGSGRQRERTGGRNLSEAKRTADELSRDADDVDQSSVTLTKLALEWIGAQTHWGPPMRSKVTSLVTQHLLTEVGNVRCRQLTAVAAGNVLTEMKARGYAHESRKDVAKYMRAIGKFGVKSGAWSSQRDPLQDLRVARPSADDRVSDELIRPEDIPSRQQVQNLIDAMERRGDTLWGLAARVIDVTGVRWQEVAALTDAHLDLDRRILTVAQAVSRGEHGEPIIDRPKSFAARRSIPMTEELCERLRVFLGDEWEPGRLLFEGPRGGIPRANNIGARVLNPARDECDFPNHCAWHSIRHTTISRWVASGDVANASKLAGHKSPAFTLSRYVGTDNTHLAAARLMVDG